MKSQLTILLLVLSSSVFSQKINFKNLGDYGDWMMNYYLDPNPGQLFDAFKFGARNKEIKQAGSLSNTIGFFASCLRSDTLLQSSFFRKLYSSRNKDLIHGFGLLLWYIHSDHSLNKLEEFENLDQVKKYKPDFIQLQDRKFTDIWADSILDPDHLDMLWADFFATGSERSVGKIISKLSDFYSADFFDRKVAESAIWSLTSNSINHKRVSQICQDYLSIADEKTKEILEEILIEVTKQKRK